MRFPVLALAVFSISASAFCIQADEFLRIDSPVSNETVYGNVEITGTAAVPGMMRYRVEFAYDPDPTGTWFLIAEGIQPVKDGLLAEWDTTLVSEGDYALRIAAYFADGSIRETVTRGIRVRHNTSPALVPSIEAVTPAEVASQINRRGRTAFPAPTAMAESGSPAVSSSSSSLGIAFLAGAILTVLGFGLIGLRSRWLWWKHRRFVRQIRKSENKHE
jgi:hypothetical protein